MLTTLKLALATAIAASGGYALQGAIDAPQTGQPVLASAADAPIAPQDQLSKRVSLRLDGTVSDVAKWLTEQGISFVIADNNLSQKKVMVNLVDQPLRAALDALSEALGGSWQKKGDVYVFQGRDSGDSFRYRRWDPSVAPALPSTPSERVFIAPKIDGKAFEFTMPDIKWEDIKDAKGRKLTDAERKQVEKAMKEANEEMKAAHTQMQKALEEAHKAGKARVFINDKDHKIFVKELDAAKIKPMSEAERKAFEKSMKELEHQLGKIKVEVKGLGGAKLLKEKDLAKVLDKQHALAPSFVFEKDDIAKLLKSLTPAQKELHKKQGFLTPSDLTADQKKMLPNMQGSWNITLVIDGEKLSIKSGK